MKNVILILLSLLALSTSTLTIVNATGEQCDDSSGKGMIELSISGDLPKTALNFTLTLKGTDEITADCYLEGSSSSDEASDSSLITDNADDTEQIDSGLTSSTDVRRLAESSATAVCLFEAPSTKGSYSLSSVSSTELTLTSGLSVNVIPCPESSDSSSDEGESEEERLAKLTLTFRQLNGFQYTDSEITFMFYALTTAKMTKGEIIYMMVNLIHTNGEMEEDPIEATCTLQDDADPGSKGLAPANFKCSIKEFTGGPYKSFRFLSSPFISGIPLDETLLNPLLTAMAIANGLLVDCSTNPPIPSTFTLTSLNQDTCATDGKLTMEGEFSDTTTSPTKFEIPLTSPANKTLTCKINGNKLECVTDRDINDEIIIQQSIIKQGAKELFILKAITGQTLKCGNGLLILAKEKANVKVSFRQVSQLKFDSASNILSFFFAAFLNSQVSTSDTIILKVLLLISGTQVEKEAKCKLINAVTYSGSPVQGDFNCEVQLESGESIDINDPLAFLISPDNDEVGGCSELTDEEASPKATDDLIANGTIVDFSLEENKAAPPLFTINSFEPGRCEKKGKFKVKGTFTGTFEKPITFLLPLTFPNSKIKCVIESGGSSEITCKVQKFFSGVKSLVIEPRTFKKYNKEYLFIKSSGELNSDEEFICGDFNAIKKKNALAAKKAPFSFLQLGRPSSAPSGFLFFIALIRKLFVGALATRSFTIEYLITSGRLRFLGEYEDKDLSCSLGESTDDTGAFNCEDSTVSGTPKTAELNPAEISGASDETKVEENPSPDYSKKENLETIQNLAKINITSMDGSKCLTDGNYNITGKIVGGSFNETEYKNLTIPFSNPDSNGVCEVYIDSSDVTMACHNSEAFEAQDVIVPNQLINYDDGATPLFLINNDLTDQFGCAVSLDSDPEKDDGGSSDSIDDTATPSSTETGRYYRKKGSSGLSGGAIAGIVIACVAVVAILGAVIALAKSGKILSATKPAFDQNSTVGNFNIPVQTENIA